MKLQLLTILFICFIVPQGFTQNWKTSGNAASPGDFIGTTNNTGLDFRTNDTSRMKIEKSGKIKITSPLNVDSSVNFNGQAIFKGVSGDAILPEPGIPPGPQDDYWFTTNRFSVMGAHLVFFPLPHYAPNPLITFGVNTQSPKYMLDVYCDPTTAIPVGGTDLDINVQCPNCPVTQSVGYRIGGNMFL